MTKKLLYLFAVDANEPIGKLDQFEFKFDDLIKDHFTKDHEFTVIDESKNIHLEIELKKKVDRLLPNNNLKILEDIS